MEFFQVLLPIFGIFALGYIGEKKIGFDTKTISTMSLYLMSPVLVFRTFYTTEFNQDYLYMTFYAFALCFALISVVYVVSYIRKYSTVETCGMILASVFMNNGNYGTPVILLLFGAAGLDYGIILMVIQSLVMGTVGVYYAAKGSPNGDGVRSALRRHIGRDRWKGITREHARTLRLTNAVETGAEFDRVQAARDRHVVKQLVRHFKRRDRVGVLRRAESGDARDQDRRAAAGSRTARHSQAARSAGNRLRLRMSGMNRQSPVLPCMKLPRGINGMNGGETSNECRI